MRAKRGETVYDFCRRLCAMSAATGQDVAGEFQGKHILATPRSTRAELELALQEGLIEGVEPRHQALEATSDETHERTNELLTQILVELHEISHRQELLEPARRG